VKIQRYTEGTRVVIRGDRLPLDAALVGRTGTVVQHDRSHADWYSVQLDGESEFMRFSEAELQPEKS
jgi:hypothetical protein